MGTNSTSCEYQVSWRPTFAPRAAWFSPLLLLFTHHLLFEHWILKNEKTSDPQNGSGSLLIKVQKTSHLLMKQKTNPQPSFHQHILWGSRTVESHEVGVCTITMGTLMKPQLMTSWIGGLFQVSPSVLNQRAKGRYCRCFLNGLNFCTSFVGEMAKLLLKPCHWHLGA